MNQQYWCSVCRQPTEPRLWESGAGSACHQSVLMILLHDADNMKRDWRSGLDYDALHIKYVSPSDNCECDACDLGRIWERADEQLCEECPTYLKWSMRPKLRPLTPDELEDLTTEMARELEAEMSPAERARQRIMNQP